jgi:hypothetical protein
MHSQSPDFTHNTSRQVFELPTSVADGECVSTIAYITKVEIEIFEVLVNARWESRGISETFQSFALISCHFFKPSQCFSLFWLCECLDTYLVGEPPAAVYSWLLAELTLYVSPVSMHHWREGHPYLARNLCDG